MPKHLDDDHLTDRKSLSLVSVSLFCFDVLGLGLLETEFWRAWVLQVLGVRLACALDFAPMGNFVTSRKCR